MFNMSSHLMVLDGWQRIKQSRQSVLIQQVETISKQVTIAIKLADEKTVVVPVSGQRNFMVDKHINQKQLQPSSTKTIDDYCMAMKTKLNLDDSCMAMKTTFAISTLSDDV